MEKINLAEYEWRIAQGNFGNVLLLCRKEKLFEKRIAPNGAISTSYANKRTLPEFTKR